MRSAGVGEKVIGARAARADPTAKKAAVQMATERRRAGLRKGSTRIAHYDLAPTILGYAVSREQAMADFKAWWGG